MSTREPSVRIVTGETLDIGGVKVTVEVDEGELVVRVGRVKRVPGGVALTPGGYGHVTVCIDGGRLGLQVRRAELVEEDEPA